MESSTFLQTLADALLVMLPGKKLLAVVITVDMTQHRPDLEYPLLDLDSAELIPAGDQEVDESDPSTYLYQRQLEGGLIETVVVYAIPVDFDVDSLTPWSEALASDATFQGFIQKVEIMPFMTKVGNS